MTNRLQAGALALVTVPSLLAAPCGGARAQEAPRPGRRDRALDLELVRIGSDGAPRPLETARVPHLHGPWVQVRGRTLAHVAGEHVRVRRGARAWSVPFPRPDGAAPLFELSPGGTRLALCGDGATEVIELGAAGPGARRRLPHRFGGFGARDETLWLVSERALLRVDGAEAPREERVGGFDGVVATPGALVLLGRDATTLLVADGPTRRLEPALPLMAVEVLADGRALCELATRWRGARAAGVYLLDPARPSSRDEGDDGLLPLALGRTAVPGVGSTLAVAPDQRHAAWIARGARLEVVPLAAGAASPPRPWSWEQPDGDDLPCPLTACAWAPGGDALLVAVGEGADEVRRVPLPRPLAARRAAPRVLARLAGRDVRWVLRWGDEVVLGHVDRGRARR